MKVLYIGAVGPFGGASRSLYEAVARLPRPPVRPYFLMPRGTALDFYRRVAEDSIAAIGISRFDHSRATRYRGLRWLVVLRELAYIPFTILSILAARRRWGKFDVIHVNEFMELIPGILAKRLLGGLLVVHVRSLVETNRDLWRTRWLHRALRRSADKIIAIDQTVRETLPADIDVDVIHNSFTAEPPDHSDERYLAQLNQLRPETLKVGFVGNLLRIKGLGELLEAARILKARNVPVQFLIVGGVIAKDTGARARMLNWAGLGQNLGADLAQRVRDYGLEGSFLLLGATSDIQSIYPRMDVLAFPSHFDAPGRPVFESAFFGVPSIVAVRNPKPDTLVHGETGIAIDAPDPELLANAIDGLERDRAEVCRLGENARALAERNFRPDVNAAELYHLYEGLVDRRSDERGST